MTLWPSDVQYGSFFPQASSPIFTNPKILFYFQLMAVGLFGLLGLPVVGQSAVLLALFIREHALVLIQNHLVMVHLASVSHSRSLHSVSFLRIKFWKDQHKEHILLTHNLGISRYICKHWMFNGSYFVSSRFKVMKIGLAMQRKILIFQIVLNIAINMIICHNLQQLASAKQ